jgi:drug/metabolite transporter (DMT)-like permease
MRRSMLRGALGGLALGLLWGIAARVFMRLVSTNPGFSWAGTLFIVGLAATLGAGLGVVAAAQSQGRRRWWLLAAVPGLMLLAGPGMLFVPAFALGGLAFSRRHAALRVVGAGAIAGGVVLMWWLGRVDQETMLSTPVPMMVRGVVGFALLSTALAAGSSVLYRRWAPASRSAIIAPMGSAEVAAGEGALAT